MTVYNGLDSSGAPTLAQAQAAKALGFVWWGFYLPKFPLTDPLNSWTIGEVGVLRQAGFIPVPIVVPEPPHPADPVALAKEAWNSCRTYGLDPKIAVCYNGEHISVTGPVWLPVPGSKPVAVGAGSAIQYATTSLSGLEVDLNVSAVDFPAASGLVCDLEHNATYDSAWYAQFQATVHSLGGIQVPPVPDNRIRIIQANSSQVIVTMGDGSQREVTAVIADKSGGSLNPGGPFTWA